MPPAPGAYARYRMPRRFFSRISADYLRKKGPDPWYLRVPGAHPALFATRRRNIAGALALGLFIALLPVPGHTPLALAGALLLRVNLPVTLLATLVSNPLTYAPLFYVEYRLGAWLLSVPPRSLNFEVSREFFLAGLNGVWAPLFAGALVGGAVVALLAWIFTTLVWRWSTGLRYRRRPLQGGAASPRA